MLVKFEENVPPERPMIVALVQAVILVFVKPLQQPLAQQAMSLEVAP
jgi:hypothetical protein